MHLKNGLNYAFKGSFLSRLFSYLLFALILFNVQPASSLTVIYNDSTGDNYYPGDIIGLDASADPQEISIRVIFSPSTTFDSFNGQVYLDTDQNPQTGQQYPDRTDIGYEYVISLYRAPIDQKIEVYDANNTLIATLPASFSNKTIKFSVPLSDLGSDDGNLNASVLCGVGSMQNEWLPNAGHIVLVPTLPSWNVNSVNPSSAAMADWPSGQHTQPAQGSYLKIDTHYYYVVNSTTGSWSGIDYSSVTLQQCDQTTGAPLKDPTDPSQPLLADLTGTEGRPIELFSFWPFAPWAVHSIYPASSETIDWLSSQHAPLLYAGGQYVKIGGIYYATVSSSPGSWNGSSYNSVTLKQCDQTTGTPLTDPANPDAPLPADLTGTSGLPIQLLLTWPPVAWNVFSIDPDQNGSIDWYAAQHPALSQGNYLEIGATYYYVESSGVNSLWNGSTNNFARLQLCDQTTGQPLAQPNPNYPFYSSNPTIPIWANMTGTEGQAITLFTTWPVPLPTGWKIYSIDPGRTSAFDWYAGQHAVLGQGNYIKIGTTYYSVSYSWAGSWNDNWGSPTVYFNTADLQQCDQVTGMPLTQPDPYNPGNRMPVMANLTGMEGQSLEVFTSWPVPLPTGWKIYSIDPGRTSVFDWYAGQHAVLGQGNYVKIGTTYYSVSYSWAGSWNDNWGSPTVYFNTADLQQCDQVTGMPLTQPDPYNPGNRMPVMANLTGMEGQSLEVFTTWPVPLPTGWKIYSIDPGRTSAIDWYAGQHTALSSCDYIRIGNSYYFVMHSNSGSWSDNWGSPSVWFNMAELQLCDQSTGAPLTYTDPANPGYRYPLMADMTGTAGQAIELQTPPDFVGRPVLVSSGSTLDQVAAMNDLGEVVLSALDPTTNMKQIYSSMRGQLTFDASDHTSPAINNKGDVVWEQKTLDTPMHIYGIISGIPTRITFEDAQHSHPAINDHGEVVYSRFDIASYRNQIYSARRGRLSLNNTNSYYAPDINNRGDVVWQEMTDAGERSIQALMAGSASPVTVTTEPGAYGSATVSDAGEIVYTREGGGAEGLYSSTRGQLTSCVAGKLVNPDVNSCGTLTFAAQDMNNGSISIYRLGSDGPCVTEIEPNNSQEEASPISSKGRAIGALSWDQDATDWYTFTADIGLSLKIFVNWAIPSSSQLSVDLLDASGTVLQSATEEGTPKTINTQAPYTGQYYIRLSTTVGLAGYALFLETGDTVAPSVTLTSPTGWITNNPKPILEYTVTEGTVLVKVDGIVVNKASGDTLGPLSDGPHTILVESTDAEGNTGSAWVSFTVDTTPPAAYIWVPYPGITTANRNIGLYFDVSEMTSATPVIKVDGQIVAYGYGAETLGPLSDGLHTVRVELTDRAGNKGSGESTFTVDTTPPIVVISSPVSGYTNTKTPQLLFTVSEGTTTVKVDGVSVSKTSGSTLDSLSEGVHTVRVESRDIAGNTAFADVTFTVDSTVPTVSITSPVSGITNNKIPTLTYSVSDGTVVVKVDGAIVNKVSGNTLDTLADGVHTVRVEAMDTAGNTGFAEVSFTVDTAAPTVNITSPAAGLTNDNTPLLSYSVIDGSAVADVVVKVDGVTVQKASGDSLDALTDGSHTVQVEATDAAGHSSFSERTFTVDTVGPVPVITPKIEAGLTHTMVIRSDGSLWGWGSNQYGQLGDDTNDTKLSPVKIGTERWIAIATGIYHTMSIKSDGTLWGWGYNQYGQLGDGSSMDRSSPVQIGTDNRWIMIAAGAHHTIGLKSDGTLWGWGRNDSGQLGNGSRINSPSPTQIGTQNNWFTISTGNSHTVAIKTDGSLWAWGENGSGQVGDGKVGEDKLAPVQVGTDKSWVSVATGAWHSLALKSDGTLWAWGSNGSGQLGNGSTTDNYSPVQVGRIGFDENNWIGVAAGSFHTIGRKSDGTLWAWGRNAEGQFGNGTTVNKLYPVYVGMYTDVEAQKLASIAAGGNHNLALTARGDLYAWGANSWGQVGIGRISVSELSRSYILGGVAKNSNVTIDNGISFTNHITVSTSYLVNEANGVSEMQFSSDGITWSLPEQFVSTKEWSLNTGDGTKNVYVKFKDNAQNWSPAFSARVILDTSIPTVSIASPTPATTNDNTPLLTYTITDATINGSSDLNSMVTMDGVRIFTGSGQSLDALADGTHTLRVEATDSAGNTGFAEVTFEVDTPPTASISSPASGSTNNNAPLLTYSVSDGAVTVKVDGIVVNKVSGNNLDPLADGAHTVRVEATDAGGTGFAERIFTVDTVAPIISITSPTAGTTTDNQPLLTYTASDGAVTVKVDGIAVNKVSGNTLNPLTEGPHMVRVEATDAAGNIGFAEVAFTVDIPPTVTIASPAASFTNNNAPLLTYSVSNGEVVVKIDNIIVNKVSGNNLDPLADGAHTVRVEATDAGGTGFAERTFTVDTVAPTVTISSPSTGMTTDNQPLLSYTVSDGTVTVKVDGVVVNKVSGNRLDTLSNGSHTVRVESRDAAGNIGLAEVTFTVNAPTTNLTEDFEIGNLTKLPWVTSGNGMWSVKTTTKHGGLYAAEAPVSIVDNQSASLEVSVNCIAGNVTFWYSVSSEANFDFLIFYVDGVQKGKWSGSAPWSQASVPVTAGTHAFKWVYSKDGSVSTGSDTAWVDDIIFPTSTPNTPPPVNAKNEGFESGGLTYLPWITTGNGAWSAKTTTKHGGTYAAEAPVSIVDNQSASLEVTQTFVAGNITFWYSVSSEANWDFLRFYIDGVQQGQWSGAVAWTQAAYSLTAGTHTLKWVYIKDGSVSAGSDTAWIDDISIPIP